MFRVFVSRQQQGINEMKFKVHQASAHVATAAAVISDDALIESVQLFIDAMENLAAAEAMSAEAECVLSNCEDALAAVEEFGLSREVLAVYNRDGALFEDLGLEPMTVASMEALDAGAAKEKAKEVGGALKNAAVSAGAAVAKAAQAAWKAIIEFLRRWFTLNGRIAARLEANLPKLANADDAAFKKMKGNVVKASEIDKIIASMPAFDKLMQGIATNLPSDIDRAVADSNGNKGATDLEVAFKKTFAGIDSKLASVGLGYSGRGVFIDETKTTMFQAKEGEYGAAGWSVAYLNKNTKTVIGLLKTDKASMSAVAKSIDAGYKKAVKSGDRVDKDAKAALDHVNKVVKLKARLVNVLGSQFDMAVRKAIGGAAKAEEAAPAEGAQK